MISNSILIRGVNWLGDAVMSTPALQRLREARPAARIVLLTPEKLRELWLGHPAVDEVVAFAENDSVFSVARRLREANCGTALIFPNSPRSALECWLAKIPRRLGYARPWRTWALTDVVPPRADEVPMTKRSAYEVRLLIETGINLTRPPLPAGAHHIHQYLELVGALGASKAPCAPLLKVTDEELADICAAFGAGAKGNRTRPLIGINAGAEYGAAKRWPHERFVEAATALNQKRACDWWIFGGPGERELAEGVATDLRGR